MTADIGPTLTVLTVLEPGGKQHIPFEAGCSLRGVLELAGIRCRWGCRGNGACGLCQVRIESGTAGHSTPNERLQLDDTKLAEGIRLACQVILTEDLTITVLARDRKAVWQRLCGRHRPPAGPSSRSGQLLGVAIDVGTTHLRLSVVDLDRAQWLAGRQGLNPQAFWGADVLTRLMAVVESEEHQIRLRQVVLDALASALLDVALGDGLDVGNVRRVCLVGNTAMLALLGACPCDRLLQPQYWTRAMDCAPEATRDWAVHLGLAPEVDVALIQPLAGFVGSDLLAGILETDLTGSRGGALLVDVGTNSEIALWDGQTLWVTSAAGGPAFEGSGISCGLPGEPGAVHRVRQTNGIFEVEVIGGQEPRGLCGSGLVDVIAELLQAGFLTTKGRFTPPVPEGRFTLGPVATNLGVTLADVDVFQRAKAALGAGIQVLANRAGMHAKALERLCICGVFGRYLNIANAQAVGLLPQIAPSRVELFENAALAGCEQVLLSPEAMVRLARIRAQSTVINLSHCSEFDDAYLNHLYLRPFEVI